MSENCTLVGMVDRYFVSNDAVKDPLQSIAMAMIIQAYKDVTNVGYVKNRKEAYDWLMSEEAEIYFEGIGVDPDAARRWLIKDRKCNEAVKEIQEAIANKKLNYKERNKK